MSLYRSSIVFIAATFLLSGCSFLDSWVYRPDINQGNYVTQQALEQLKVGQTKEQVLYVMGTPVLGSVFDDNVWYYVFRQNPQHSAVSQETYTVIFDKKGIVSDIKTSSYKNSNLEQMDNADLSQPE